MGEWVAVHVGVAHGGLDQFGGLPVGAVRDVKSSMFMAMGGTCRARGTKYDNDYGGPSYSWRDTMMSRLHTAISAKRLDSRVFDELDELFGQEEFDFEVHERLEAYIASRNLAVSSADELLSGFSKQENTRHRVATVGVNVARNTGTVVVGAVIGWLLLRPAVPVTILLSLAAVLSLLAMVWGYVNEVPYFLTTKRLRQMQSRNQYPRVDPGTASSLE